MGKTEYMLFNQKENRNKNISYHIKINNSIYIVSWMNITTQDIEMRKDISWRIMHNINKIWNYKL